MFRLLSIVAVLLTIIITSNGMYDHDGHRFWNPSIRARSDRLLKDFRANMKGVTFSGVFNNNTVLQRQPDIAAVYGAADKSNVKITLTINGKDSNGNSYNNVLSTNSNINGDWKIILNSAMKSGGNYTFNVKCDLCTDPSIQDTLYNITFGDVYYCSGQSNMQLPIEYTFNRNNTFDAINKFGKYSNIRHFIMWPTDTSTPTYVVPHNYDTSGANGIYKWSFANDTEFYPPKNQDVLIIDQFGAPCWYFAQTLYDYYGIQEIPIGLIETAQGGTMIEQWIKNETIQSHCKDSICPDPKCGGLYNGMVSTFVNMTIKAYIWWQGENNMAGTPGSWLNNTGYGCMQPLMLNQWRNIWSVSGSGTSIDAPFGLVTLAAGTDEGMVNKMGAMRWAQMANFDYLPNIEMRNTFVALGHDMGEPWGDGCQNQKPPVCNVSGVPYSLADTPPFMGPIHPRIKLPIGQRLAYAGYNMLYGDGDKDNVVSGPLISGCSMDLNKKQIVINFNTTYLNGEIVEVIPWSAWYNKSLTVHNWSAMKVGDENGKWEYVNISKSATNNHVIVDISQFIDKNITITGLRYAYDTFPCCGDLNMQLNPCPPDQCPIKSKIPNTNITLPAVPFWAQIIDHKCKCFAPQTCSE